MKQRYWLKQWEKQPKIAGLLSILGLLLVGWVVFLRNLGSTGLIDETEPLFAEAARQMVVTGDWITPYFNGDTRFDKPPLIYWLMAIGYKLIGVNEWAVRLPSALAAIALMGLGFYTLRYFGFPTRLSNPPESRDLSGQLWFSAALGAIAIALNPHTIVWGRIGVSDMLLSSCMGSALLAFFLGYAKTEQQREETENPNSYSHGYTACYILLALAVLTKGPVGIVLPGLIIASFLLYVGQLKAVLQEMRWRRGLLLFLAIALPWYGLVIAANGHDYVESFFGYHNIERFTRVVNHHSAPWYFYFIVVLVGFAPWSVYLPIAIAQTQFWRRRVWQHQKRSRQLSLFACFWFISIFGFFTTAVTKLPSYVLPLIPAAAILVALRFSAEFSPTDDRNHHRGLLISGIVNIIFCLAVAAIALYLPKLAGDDPAMPNFPEVLQQSGLPLQGAIIWILMALSTAFLLWRRQFRWLWSANLIGFLLFLVVVVTPASFLADSQRQLPLRQLAQTATEVRQPNEQLIMVGFEKPSLVFYTQQPVKYILRATSTVEYLQTLAVEKPNPPTVLLLGYPNKIGHTGLQPDRYQDLGHKGAYQLLRVAKQEFLPLTGNDN